MSDLKVLVSAALPRHLDHNAYLQSYIVSGFQTVLGNAQVSRATYELSPQRILVTRPDLVLVAGSCRSEECEFVSLRRACDRAGTLFAFWLMEDPYEFDSVHKITDLADHLFSNDRWSTLHYDRPNVWHLPLAACPSQAPPTANGLSAKRDGADVFFCGVGFPNRVGVLDDLTPVLKKYRTEIYGDEWDTTRFPFARNQRIPHEELASYYARSNTVLNLGRSHFYANQRYRLPPSTPGPRTFEAAMAGACQMMYVESLEILDYFVAGQEVLLFNDPPEFERLLVRTLEDPVWRQGIMKAAQARALRDHTYAERARTILRCVGLSEKNAVPEASRMAPDPSVR